tara:strand:- start:256 stop:396 length:141 start_codon:yes stop_codon:yes gene_type:complete
MKYGILGFLTTPANKIKNSSNPPKGIEFSIIATGKVTKANSFKKGY